MLNCTHTGGRDNTWLNKSFLSLDSPCMVSFSKLCKKTTGKMTDAGVNFYSKKPMFSTSCFYFVTQTHLIFILEYSTVTILLMRPGKLSCMDKSSTFSLKGLNWNSNDFRLNSPEKVLQRVILQFLEKHQHIAMFISACSYNRKDV